MRLFYLSWTRLPIAYAAFCLAYDVIIAGYCWRRYRLWDADK